MCANLPKLANFQLLKTIQNQDNVILSFEKQRKAGYIDIIRLTVTLPPVLLVTNLQIPVMKGATLFTIT